MARATTKDKAPDDAIVVEDKQEEKQEPTETDALLVEPAKPFTLSDGSTVLVRQLNLKEFLVMMRIVTRGAAVAFSGGVSLDPNSPSFVQDFVSLFIFAVAESEYEACEFLRVMVDPVEDTLENNQKLDELMANPSLEDTVDIVNYIVAKAAPSIQSLGKRLATLMNLANRVGQVK